MKLLTLGQLELRGSSFTRAKPLLLLTYLSLEGEQSREYLAELFWTHGSSRQRRNNLSKALSDLRAAVPDSVDNTNTRVWSLVENDVAEFRRALASENYAAATKLYGGQFLEGHASGLGVELEEWLYKQREHLAQAAQEAHLILAERGGVNGLEHARVALRLTDSPVDLLRRFYALFKTQDKQATQAVLELARGYGVSLAESSSVEPGSVESGSEEPGSVEPGSIEPSLIEPEAEASPQPGSSDTLTSFEGPRLPFKATSFVGRELELSSILYQLSQAPCRLLSLVGIGGVGKTRLAVQAGHELQTQTPDGVYFVPLEALQSADLIPATIAGILGVTLSAQGNAVNQLASAIADKHTLLIMDNFEHLLDGAKFLPALLRSCPKLKLLVTSRERLALEEEWVLPLEGFALPAAGDVQNAQRFDAVQLFVQRATQAQMTFTLTPEALEDVVALCRTLAGSPLALELAAAWTRLTPLATLRRDIERDLDTLSTQVKRAERHESLRAVFEYSWNLLTPREQTVFKRLAVFRGGFSVEAATQVTGASVADLVSLVDKSLLRMQAAGRYDRHPLVSQYAQEKLAADAGDLAQMQAKHFEYYLALAQKAQPQLKGSEQEDTLERLERDFDNYRAALEYADLEQATALCACLWRFWDVRGFWHEGRTWLDKVLAHPSKASVARAEALCGAAKFASRYRDYEVASEYLNDSLALSRTLDYSAGVLKALNGLAEINYHRNRLGEAATYMKEVLALSRARGDEWMLAGVISNLSVLAREQGRLEEAHELQRESVQLSQKLGNKKGAAITFLAMGKTARRLGNQQAAYAAYESSLTLAEDLGFQGVIAAALYNLGALDTAMGYYQKAQHHLARSLVVHQTLKELDAPNVLGAFGVLYAKQERWVTAVTLAAAFEALIEAKEVDAETRAEIKQVWAEAKNHLDENVFNDAVAEGSRLTLDAAASYALDASPNPSNGV